MSFFVETITLKGFRSYRHAQLTLDPELTILCGANATGKTNLIEALQLLTAGASFRKPQARDLIHWECVQAQATLQARGETGQREVTVTLVDNTRRFTVNGKPVRSTQEIATPLPCVIFTPGDLRIVKDSSQRRRDELDALGIQLSATYARLLSEYRKIITQRNRLLKEEQFGTEVFQAWTQRLVDVGVALYKKRISLYKKLAPHIKDNYHRIDPHHTLEVSFESAWAPEEPEGSERPDVSDDDLHAAFFAALEERADDEQSGRQSAVGPHRDDILFAIDGRPARAFASQGQQRSIALAWKLAELSVVEDISGTRPLLLLDDVMSELDEERRAKLAHLVGTIAQTVITTANIDYFQPELLKRAHVIHIPAEVCPPEEREEECVHD